MAHKISHPFSSLKHKNYRLFTGGYLISRIGSEMQAVAVAWQIYTLTGSAFSLGIIGLSRFLPVITLAPVAGIAADKIDRKKIIMVTQILMMVFSLALAFTTFTKTKNVSPLLIYLLIGLNSLAGVFDTPTRQSYITSLVPAKDFLNAVSLNVLVFQTAIVLGPSISGFVIAYLGIGSVYLINAVSFLGVIFALMAIRDTKALVNNKVSWSLSSLKTGLSFVFKTPIIYSTMLLDFFATFFASATVLLPVFAKDILNVGPKGLGLLYAASSVGAVTAGIGISSVKNIKHQGRILIAAILCYGLATILFGLSRSFYLSLIFLFIAGAGDAVRTIIRNTMRQLITPDHLRGRMVAVNMVFFMGGPQLGEAEAGFLAALTGAPLSVVIGGVGTLLATSLISILIPSLRKYQGER